jgi:hypothetical protein
VSGSQPRLHSRDSQAFARRRKGGVPDPRRRRRTLAAPAGPGQLGVQPGVQLGGELGGRTAVLRSPGWCRPPRPVAPPVALRPPRCPRGRAPSAPRRCCRIAASVVGADRGGGPAVSRRSSKRLNGSDIPIESQEKRRNISIEAARPHSPNRPNIPTPKTNRAPPSPNLPPPYAPTLDRNYLNPRTKVRWLPFKKSLGDWHMVLCESKGRVRVRERQSAVAVRGVINADFYTP